MKKNAKYINESNYKIHTQSFRLCYAFGKKHENSDRPAIRSLVCPRSTHIDKTLRIYYTSELNKWVTNLAMKQEKKIF